MTSRTTTRSATVRKRSTASSWLYGTGTAINVGDYLIGMGYRCVSRDRKALGAETAADVLDKLADAHIKLSEGQGAELLWRDAPNKALTTLDALKIYALKTSPAFEAALYSGVRLAGPADDSYEKMVADFSRNLGVAFQILNDIKDWTGDEDNKLVSGQDVLAARPTLLLALAIEGLTAAQREELLHLIGRAGAATGEAADEIVARVRHLYFTAKVFEKADKLVDKFRAKAEALADEVEPIPLRELLYYLVDSVLEKPELPHAKRSCSSWSWGSEVKIETTQSREGRDWPQKSTERTKEDNRQRTEKKIRRETR